MKTITLKDGSLKHTTGHWIGIQQPNDPITTGLGKKTSNEWWVASG